GGYFGAGFGFILLAFLGFSRLQDIHQMQAVKNVSSLAIASMSVLILSHSHLVDWHHGVFMATGCAIGGWSGARMSLRLSNHAVRVTVGCIGLVTATYIL